MTSLSAASLSLTWDIAAGDAGTITGGSGTWTDGSGNWNTGSADTTWSNANPDSATFGGTAGTVTLGGAITAGMVTFSSAGYIIDTNGFDATWATLAAGANGFTKTGAGTLTLTGTGTGTGLVTIGGGTIKIGAFNAVAGAVTVNAGGVYDFNGKSGTLATTLTLNGGKIDSSLNASIIGLDAGKILLTADSEIKGTSARSFHFKYTGGTLDLNGKTLTHSARIWVEGATTIANGTYLLNNQFDTYGNRTTWSDTASLTIGTGGSINLNGNDGALKNVSATAGAITLNGTGTSITQTIAGARTIAATISGGNTLTFGGVSGAVTTLTGANTYSGGTTLTGGTIVTGNSAALGSGAVTLGGGTLQVGATNLAGIASLTVNTGTLDTTLGNVTTTGAFALAGGTWVIGDTADAITAGSFTLTGGVIDLTGFTNKSTEGTYSLISGTGSSSLTDANFSNGAAGFSYSINANGDLTVTAVPEPSTYGLLGAGALAVTAFVRRRRKAKSA